MRRTSLASCALAVRWGANRFRLMTEAEAGDNAESHHSPYCYLMRWSVVS